MWVWITIGLVLLASLTWVIIYKFTDFGAASERAQAIDPETAQALRDAQQQIDTGRAYGHMFGPETTVFGPLSRLLLSDQRPLGEEDCKSGGGAYTADDPEPHRYGDLLPSK